MSVADVGRAIERQRRARALPAAPALSCIILNPIERGFVRLEAPLRKARVAHRIVAFSLGGLSRRMLQAEARSRSCRNHARVSVKPSRNET
jgi:hypothetical protein